jgi:hypothetical protein
LPDLLLEVVDSPQIVFLVFVGQIAEGNTEKAIGLSLTIDQ